MHIKSYKTKSFAGIRDVNIEFEKGLNVILGENESGKSTIINGIYATLFKDKKVGKSRKDDLEFTRKFMPLAGGDSIDGSLEIATGQGSYILEKSWGESELSQLSSPESGLINNQEAINEKLAEILNFGQSTYENIVFARQDNLKTMLDRIAGDGDIKREIGYVLRKSLMELDGLSVDQMQEAILKEYNLMFSKWDRQKQYPENNRGISNPYKIGLGKIVESYYEMEGLRIKMQEAKRREEEFETLEQELGLRSQKLADYSRQKQELEALEDDINRSQILELRIKSIKAELDKLIKILELWPVLESEIKSDGQELLNIKARKQELTKKLGQLGQLARKKDLESRLEKLKELDSKLEAVERDLSKLPKIKEEELEELEEVSRELEALKASLNAGSLILKMKNPTEDITYISRDFGEKEELGQDLEVEAKNSFNIYYRDLELEISLGQLDYKALNQRKIRLEQDKLDRLNDWGLESLDKARYSLEKIRGLGLDLKALETEKKLILANEKLKDLKEELMGLSSLRQEASKEELEQEKTKLEEVELNLASGLEVKKSRLEEWEEDYGSFKDLILETAMLQYEGQELDKEIEQLSQLPEDFKTADDFKDRLKFLRESVEEIGQELQDLNRSYYEAKNRLFEESYEELKKAYLDAEKSYLDKKNRGDKLAKIKQVFLETKDRMEENPMEPLLEDFLQLVALITQDRYTRGEIDEDFRLSLEKSSHKLPFDLLSAGTYDSVSLALRFALLKYIFKDGGFLILDDCLVDLDPGRRQESISLIQEFSKDYQIIFTSCDPRTARELGGNLIEI